VDSGLRSVRFDGQIEGPESLSAHRVAGPFDSNRPLEVLDAGYLIPRNELDGMVPAVRPLRSLPDRSPLGSLALAILACIALGASGSVFTATGSGTWYDTLELPEFAPPGWVFGPVWTTLFALMGVAAWLVWRRVDTDRLAPIALGIFVVHFAINVAWSAAFFGLQSPLAGLATIVVLLGFIVATIAAFARVDRRAAALLLPYLAWVCFATLLNYRIWVLN
jgi:tryptophan-rich sensory protein